MKPKARKTALFGILSGMLTAATISPLQASELPIREYSYPTIPEKQLTEEQEALHYQRMLLDFQESEKADNEFAEEDFFEKGHFDQAHIHANHSVIGKSAFADFIWLNDGSLWAVRPEDREAIFTWKTTDIIHITPPHWYSPWGFGYIIHNTDLHGDMSKISANLIDGPNGEDAYMAHRILDVDYSHKKIALGDGTVWKVAKSDHRELLRWNHGDIVIIGTNAGLSSWFNPSILINTNLKEYIKCERSH